MRHQYSNFWLLFLLDVEAELRNVPIREPFNEEVNCEPDCIKQLVVEPRKRPTNITFIELLNEEVNCEAEPVLEARKETSDVPIRDQLKEVNCEALSIETTINNTIATNDTQGMWNTESPCIGFTFF